MAYRSALIAGITTAVASLVVVLGACSSSDTSSTPATTTTSEGGVTVAEDLCKSAGSYDACTKCCNAGYGYTAAQDAFDACMCAGRCAGPCADSACVTNPDASVAPQSDACNTCLIGDPNGNDPEADACAKKAEAVCAQDQGCTRYTTCVSDECKQYKPGGH